MEREPIDQPLLTGTKIVDMLIPLGKGQRELIVGDRQTGKTALALDAIINQKGKDVICIYCWIGGSNIAFQKVVQALQSNGAMEYTICVCASGGSSSAQQYIAPYTAAVLGEYFMYNGKDVLVVFDDLTKHAWIYRQMSLLLERAPGRGLSRRHLFPAFPTDGKGRPAQGQVRRGDNDLSSYCRGPGRRHYRIYPL